jgi:Kef-type K+ transport system membrane component KefB
VRLYSLIFLVMVVLVVVDSVRIGSRSLPPVLACLAGGVVIGVIASRMFSLSWDTVSKKVIGKLDVVGAVVLVLYVAVSIFRSRLLGLWLEGPVLSVAGLAVLAGIMAGQVAGTRRGVVRVFRLLIGEQNASPAAAESDSGDLPSS